jgi:hypothetical protein
MGGPLLLEGFPSEGRTATFALGEVPEAVKVAWRMRRIFGRMALRALGEHQPREDEQAVAEELFASEETAFPTESWNWYITVEVSESADVPDVAILDRRFGWIDLSESMSLLETFGQECAPHLDRLVSYLALFVEEGFLSNLVAEMTFLAADGRLPIAWPRFESAVEMKMTYAASRLDVKGLRDFAARLSKRQEPAKSPLDTPRHWFLQAIGEEDPARQFMMCFWALEVLAYKVASTIGRHGNSAKGWRWLTNLMEVLRRTCGRREKPLTQCFMALQKAFGVPEDRESDLKAFKKVKAARDKLSHGGWYDLETLPVSGAYQLMRKYFLAALKRTLDQDVFPA